MAGRRGRGSDTPPMNRVTKNAGMNRFIWDGRHSNTLAVPPGPYQVRLTAAGRTLTKPFTLKIDPNFERDGLTVADLREQYEHNLKMREMVLEVGRVVQRVRSAQSRLANASGTAADSLKRVEALAARLLPEPVRYGKPGLQTQITYLAGMTSRTDQQIGRDAVERHAVLRRELDAIKREVDQVLGPDPGGG